MIVIFWLSIALLGYTYVGYAVLIRMLSRRGSVADSALTPPLTVVIAAYNESRASPRGSAIFSNRIIRHKICR